jgi:hypothetical protein
MHIWKQVEDGKVTWQSDIILVLPIKPFFLKLCTSTIFSLHSILQTINFILLFLFFTHFPQKYITKICPVSPLPFRTFSLHSILQTIYFYKFYNIYILLLYKWIIVQKKN